MFTGITHYHKSDFNAVPLDDYIVNEFKPENTFKTKQAYTDFISTGTSLDSFQTTQDGLPATLSFNNFVVNAGHTVTTSNRCKGLYLYIYGDLIVNGTLSMTARGANAPGKYVLINKWNGSVFYVDELNENNWFYNNNMFKENYTVISKTGGLGITSSSSWTSNSTGGKGINGACGAGGGNIMHRRADTERVFLVGAGAGGRCF